MKKKLLLAVILILIFTIGAAWKIAPPGYSSVLEANWGIRLPFKALCSQVYSGNSGSGFHGDGIRYHVFSYRYEDYIDLMFAWRGREGSTLFHGSYQDAAEKWLDEIGVPAGERPNYERCFSWYKAQEDNSELIIFWDNDLNRLYILESFL